jgi:type IV conjugative transfer system protein TraE
VDGKTLLSRMDDLLARNRLLGIALIVMLAWNLMNWTAMFRARSEMQTVIVPIGGGNGMTVGHGKASEAYLREMARYVTWMVGDYTAATIRGQLQELLQLFPSDRIGQVEVEFERLANEIERYPSISSVMHWSGDKPLKYTRDLIQVHATKDRLVNGAVSQTKSIYYCIHYRITDSKFSVLSVIEKEGTGEDLCLGQPSAPNRNRT